MATETSPPTTTQPLAAGLSGRAKLWISVALLAGVGLLAWLLLREAGAEQRLEQWDVYGQLRSENEWEELFFEGEAPLYQAARDRYVRQLEAFAALLEKEAAEDALEPQTRWRIAKTEGESLLSMKDVLDVAQRLPHTENAIRQLETIMARFPSFPTNWEKSFAPEGFGSTTRRMIDWFRRNADWEKQHLPRELAPDPSITVVLRTDRGDLRLGLYPQDGPNVTARFLAAVQSGAYDGTGFVERVEDTFGGETKSLAVRAGDARARDPKPYDTADALRYARADEAEGFLPDENRNRVLHVRGVVTTWHALGEEYDHPLQVLFVARPSPGLNYRHTPIGRLLDEASLATLDAIQAGKLWRDDPVVSRDSGDLRALHDLYQAPARIVKALAYKDGALFTGDVTALPTKVAAGDSERTLAGLKADAYKVAPPAPPALPAVPPAAPSAVVPGGAEEAGTK